MRKNETIRFQLDDEAKVVISPANADVGNLRNDIETLLIDFPYFIDIEVDSSCVGYTLHLTEDEKDSYGRVEFWFDNNCLQWRGRIASHWMGYRFAPI